MNNFIANHVEALPQSGIREYFDIASTVDDVISLGIGEPDFVTPDRILQSGIKSLQRGDTHYTANAGMMELREALSAHLEKLYGICYDPQKETLITVGVSEALYLAFAATINPGDEVLVPEPCFVSYSAQVTLAHGKPIAVGTSVAQDFQITPDAIEAAITPKTRALLIGFPSNPTGAVMTRDNLIRIADLADKYNLLVISDEIYDRLVYDCDHVCFASLPGMHDRTLTLGGFSKDYAMTGWRLGYAVGPMEVMSALRKIHQYTIMSAPTTSQVAALEALRTGDEYVEEMRTKYDRRRRLIVDGMNTIGLKCFEPRGAFYAFPSIAKSGMDEHIFAKQLLMEEKVAVVPGSAFGPSGTGYIRCSYATAYEKIEEALRRIERFIHRHR